VSCVSVFLSSNKRLWPYNWIAKTGETVLIGRNLSCPTRTRHRPHPHRMSFRICIISYKCLHYHARNITAVSATCTVVHRYYYSKPTQFTVRIRRITLHYNNIRTDVISYYYACAHIRVLLSCNNCLQTRFIVVETIY